MHGPAVIDQLFCAKQNTCCMSLCVVFAFCLSVVYMFYMCVCVRVCVRVCGVCVCVCVRTCSTGMLLLLGTIPLLYMHVKMYHLSMCCFICPVLSTPQLVLLYLESPNVTSFCRKRKSPVDSAAVIFSHL